MIHDVKPFTLSINSQHHTDKKKNEIYLIFKEIHMGFCGHAIAEWAKEFADLRFAD